MERTKKRRPFRSLLGDIRGTATTEAVIMLPFFILVWSCVIYVSRKYDNMVQVQAQSRHCAWRYAKDNCSGDAPVTGCSIGDGADMGESSEMDAAVAQAESASSSAGGWGFIGDIMDALGGKEITATTTVDVPKPELIGGGSAHLVGQTALACNIEPKDGLDGIVSEAWGALWHGL